MMGRRVQSTESVLYVVVGVPRERSVHRSTILDGESFTPDGNPNRAALIPSFPADILSS